MLLKKVKEIFLFQKPEGLLKTSHKSLKVFKILTGGKIEIECLFSVFLELGTSYFSVIGENILFKTIIYRYLKWCTQRLCIQSGVL